MPARKTVNVELLEGYWDPVEQQGQECRFASCAKARREADGTVKLTVVVVVVVQVVVVVVSS